jgi:hypothetical protein
MTVMVLEIKESISQSVHQEFESSDGGGWFSSGDYYLHTQKSRWIYFLGIPIWRLSSEWKVEFYEPEHIQKTTSCNGPEACSKPYCCSYS